MPEKKHVHFQTEEIELNRVKNAKLIHFKDELGRPIDGQLIIGEVEEVKKQNFERPKEVEVKRNLGKFKKALAYLGIIKNTKKITITEIYREDVVTKKKDVIGFHSLGDFKNDKESINDFVQELKKYKGAKAYDLNDNEIGYINNEGNLIRNENIKIDFNETILQKNGKVFAIEKNGKFLDLEGKALQNQNQFIQKSSGVYHLSGADIKYFDKDEDIKTSKGITNLNKKPVRSALKGSREATKIGEQLRKQQEEKQFAGIKKPKGAKLTKVGIPVVPTR